MNEKISHQRNKTYKKRTSWRFLKVKMVVSEIHWMGLAKWKGQKKKQSQNLKIINKNYSI